MSSAGGVASRERKLSNFPLLSADNIYETMGKTDTGLDYLFRLAYDHLNLIAEYAKDPLLRPENRVFDLYNPDDFEEVEGNSLEGVAASWYADEKSGARFQARIASTPHQFNTYEYTAALNQSLLNQGFKLGDYVKVIYPSKEVREKEMANGPVYTTETIVLLTDIKGNPGIDLSKVAAYDIGLPNVGKVDLVLVRPKNCTPDIKTEKKHPMASCYRKDFYVENDVSQRIDARFNRRTVMPFLARHWELAYVLKFFGMTGGIAKPFVKAEFAPVKSMKIHLISRWGPFKTFEEAEQALKTYCSLRHPEGAPRDSCASPEKIKADDWGHSAKSIKFRKGSRQKTVASKTGKDSPVRIASAKARRK